MSVPVWKQAILKKRQEQGEAERRKQREREQYLASLPPWKRAMKEKKKEGAISQTTNMKTTVNDSIVKPKPFVWKQSQVEDDKERKILGSDKVQKPEESRTDVSEIVGITQALKGKFEKLSPKLPSKELALKGKIQQTSTKRFPKEAAVKVDVKEDIRTNNQKEEIEETNSTPQHITETQDNNLQKLRGQFEQTSSRPKLTKAMSQTSIDVDDPKFLSMPKWKQELIIRKRLQQNKAPQPFSKTSPISSPAQSPTAKTPPISFDLATPLPSSTLPSSPKSFEEIPKEQKPPTEAPEVVNASNKKGDDSPKLLHKEGKSIRPPAIKPNKKWAEIKEDDPEFLNLPEWKRVLILRRKNDYAKRTAPPVEEKKQEKKEEEKNEPLPTPLWSPTRNETKEVIRPPPPREIVEGTNPALEWRKNLKRVKKPQSSKQEKTSVEANSRKISQGGLGRLVKKENEREAEETLSPLAVSPAEKTPKKRLRKVSWSDTELNKSLTVEFVYLKYSYHDYDSIDQESIKLTNGEDPIEETDKNDLATPLHPWLSPTPASPPQAASTGNSMTAGFSPMSFGSLGSFMSAYTNDISSSGRSDSTMTQNHLPPKEPNPDPVETYNEDTAALIW